MLRLHPGLGLGSAEYGARVAEVREVIWTIAERVLITGVDGALHPVTEEMNTHLASLPEEPTGREGMQIRRH